MAFLRDLGRAGVSLARDGDGLRVDAPDEFDLGPWLPWLERLKLALLAALDWHAAVTVPAGFDRQRADLLYARLIALEQAAGIALLGVGEDERA